MANSTNGVNQQNMGEQVSIEISEYSKLLADSIGRELNTNTMSPSSVKRSCCIRRVHEKFRRINEFAYAPEMISIGPFHSDKVALQAMEQHKLRYMNALISRSGNPGAKLEECVEVIGRSEDEVRNCYAEPVESDKSKFIRVMVVDGLFIIELFRKSALQESIHEDDPILSIKSKASLVRDMMLLENQLPMFVLESLFDITIGKQQGGKSLNKLAIGFFNPLMKKEETILDNCSINIKGKHLLDLITKTFHHLAGLVETNIILELKRVPSVTELRWAKIECRRRFDARSFLDIRFIDGVLEIPHIIIHDRTESLLRNLIASEQCNVGSSSYMTSYAFFMGRLINSSDDVKYLCEREIITHYLGDDECVSSLFEKLCSEVTLVNFYYSGLCDEVNAHYRTDWHARKATMMHYYMQKPWLMFKVYVMLLSAISTVFAVLSFTLHNS